MKSVRALLGVATALGVALGVALILTKYTFPPFEGRISPGAFAPLPGIKEVVIVTQDACKADGTPYVQGEPLKDLMDCD